MNDADARHQITLNTHSEHHFFAIAAHKLIEYRDCVQHLVSARTSISPKSTGFKKPKYETCGTCVNTLLIILKGRDWTTALSAESRH
jgi:hypothetical protein